MRRQPNALVCDLPVLELPNRSRFSRFCPVMTISCVFIGDQANDCICAKIEKCRVLLSFCARKPSPSMVLAVCFGACCLVSLTRCKTKCTFIRFVHRSCSGRAAANCSSRPYSAVVTFLNAPVHLPGRRCTMHDALVSRLPCTRDHGVITQGKTGGRAAAPGRAAPVPPADTL